MNTELTNPKTQKVPIIFLSSLWWQDQICWENKIGEKKNILKGNILLTVKHELTPWVASSCHIPPNHVTECTLQYTTLHYTKYCI